MKIKIITAIAFIFLITGSALADEVENFFVEPSYDVNGREMVSAFVEKETDHAYFYIEEGWWNSLSEETQEDYQEAIDTIGEEFEDYIYPEVSSFFGSMPQHKVVGDDEKMSVLFHPMKNTSGGYFRTGDQYSTYQYNHSNERNMVYLNANLINDKNIKGYLAHEYVHLVTFNEKNREHRQEEETWLNELRAELIISILGYNEEYEGSNLETRVGNFLYDPDFSLVDWTDQAADYGVINLFGHYLINHYGEEIISTSLKSEFVGIPSINYALEEEGYDKTFSDVFSDWVIAVYLNDCSYGDRYCYKNEDLKDIEVSPSNIFISPQNKKPFSLEYKTKNWAGNWYRIAGGEGSVSFNFDSNKEFTVYYVACKNGDKCDIGSVDVNNQNEADLFIEDFSSKYDSLSIIIFLGEKMLGFNGPEESFSFMWDVQFSKDEQWREMWVKLAEIRERIEALYDKLGLEPPDDI